MKTRALFDRLTLLAQVKRMMICAVACGVVYPACPAFAQQTSNAGAAVKHTNHHIQSSRRNVTGPAQLSSSGSQTPIPLPDAPSAVQRDSPAVSLAAPDERFSAYDSAGARLQTTVGPTDAQSTQPQSEPLEWGNSDQGCARPKGLGLARHIFEDSVQVGTANYDGGTIAFYVKVPDRTTMLPCNTAHPH